MVARGLEPRTEQARLLNLAYEPSTPRATLAAMERAGKRMGLPLEVLERLGQDERLCEGFLEAVRDGTSAGFLARLDGLRPAAELVEAVPKGPLLHT